MSGSTALVENLDGLGDPADVAARFLDLPWLLLLDSASAGSGLPDARALGRYSFLCADPGAVVRSKGRVAQVRQNGAWREPEGDALDVARGWLNDIRMPPVPGLPPFQGGVAGYIGYDYGAVLERIPPTRYDDLALPDVVLGLYDWVIAWDHQSGAAWLISLGVPACGDDRARRADQRRRLVLDRLRSEPRTPPRHPGTAPWPSRRCRGGRTSGSR